MANKVYYRLERWLPILLDPVDKKIYFGRNKTISSLHASKLGLKDIEQGKRNYYYNEGRNILTEFDKLMGGKRKPYKFTAHRNNGKDKFIATYIKSNIIVELDTSATIENTKVKDCTFILKNQPVKKTELGLDLEIKAADEIPALAEAVASKNDLVNILGKFIVDPYILEQLSEKELATINSILTADLI